MLKADPRDRDLLITPLYTMPREFWAVLAVLGAMIGWGAVAYVTQLRFGLGETGLSRPVFWGVYMVNFIFLIGVSMAGTVVSAALFLVDANWRRPITRIAETLTVFGLLIAALQIVFDMGRPDRFLYVFTYGRLQSPLLWDAMSMSIYILASIGALYLQLLPDIALLRDNVPDGAPAWRQLLYRWLALGWRGNRNQWQRLEQVLRVVAILIIPIGISLHTVTSWIFSTTVQPGWKSTILGPYFVVGAIFSGLGLLVIVITAFRSRLGLQWYLQLMHYRRLRVLLIVLNITWFYFTYTEYLTLIAGQELVEVPILASKIWGEFAPTFWGMVILMVVAFWILVTPFFAPRRLVDQPLFSLPSLLVQAGVLSVALLVRFAPADLVPGVTVSAGVQDVAGAVALVAGAALALSSPVWFKAHLIPSLVIASACIVAGMWLERWNIIIPTVTHPRLIAFATYRPTWVEVAVTTGSVGLLLLLTLLFFRIFPAVSIWEAAEGRVIEAAEAQVVIPPPEPAPQRKKMRRRIRTR